MILLSSKADARTAEYLKTKDEVRFFETVLQVSDEVSDHPDILCCRLSSGRDSAAFFGSASRLSAKYPGDSIYNAAVCGKYFIHNLGITDGRLREAASAYISSICGCGPVFVNVRQGYTKCSIAVIDDSHVITSDRGIHKALEEQTDLDCLLIEPGHIILSREHSGFIGGCCGRVEGEIVFNGNVDLHPDGKKIRSFIESCGLKVVCTGDFALTDIGSIISFCEVLR